MTSVKTGSTMNVLTRNGQVDGLFVLVASVLSELRVSKSEVYILSV